MRRKATLSDERKAQLESIGFDWGKEERVTRVSTWEQRFQQLVDYKQTHGDCKVTLNYSDKPQLANWINSQRRMRRKATLSDERKAQLESIGFDWGKESGSRRIIS
jgi:hypothetical protein